MTQEAVLSSRIEGTQATLEDVLEFDAEPSDDIRNYHVKLQKQVFKMRSPIEYISFIKTPAFILHREGNPIINETEVLDFVEAMQSAGDECVCSIRRKTPDTDIQKLSYEEILLVLRQA